MSDEAATREPNTNGLEEPQTAGDGANGTLPPQFVAKETAYKSASEASELVRVDAGDVTATTVSMDRSGAERITADRVTMERSGARTMDAKSVQMDRSGVLALQSDHTVLHDSAAVALSATEARVVKSKVVFFRAEKATVEGSLRPLIHIGRADGDVRPLLDSRGALRFGAAFGLALVIGGRIVRLLFGGK
jgi:predicted deacylase